MAIVYLGITFFVVIIIANIWLCDVNCGIKIVFTIFFMLYGAVSTTFLHYSLDRFLGNFCRDMEK